MLKFLWGCKWDAQAGVHTYFCLFVCMYVCKHTSALCWSSLIIGGGIIHKNRDTVIFIKPHAYLCTYILIHIYIHMYLCMHMPIIHLWLSKVQYACCRHAPSRPCRFLLSVCAAHAWGTNKINKQEDVGVSLCMYAPKGYTYNTDQKISNIQSLSSIRRYRITYKSLKNNSERVRKVAIYYPGSQTAVLALKSPKVNSSMVRKRRKDVSSLSSRHKHSKKWRMGQIGNISWLIRNGVNIFATEND